MSAVDERRTLPAAPKPDDLNADLGFGTVVTREARQRFLNRDGTFNVRREGLDLWQSINAYHYLLTISWPKFLGFVTVAYIATNAIFAALYVACGPRALGGFAYLAMRQRFITAFFFSVHTLATIGYGNIVPLSLSANILVTIESLAGLLGFGVVAGIAFARFARPTAAILFSSNAIIASYRDITALMFRIVNQKSNQLVDLEAKVMLSRRKLDGGGTAGREFIPLALERNGVVFFPLAWTVVHPIDQQSPLYGVDEKTFRSWDPEILVMLNGFDETFSQTVHTRSSYKGDEIVWGARFKNMFNPRDEDGTISVDIRRLSEYERVALT